MNSSIIREEASDEMLRRSLVAYYEGNADRWEALLQFIDSEQKSPLALRHLDYFVVTYAEKHDTHYEIADHLGNHIPFYVHSEYKSQLKKYTKYRFDPFRRGKKIEFHGATTALKQMNFFRWAISGQVLAYAINNKETIIEEYKKDMKEAKEEAEIHNSNPANNAPRRRRSSKRRRVTARDKVRCFVYPQKVTLEFEIIQQPHKTFKSGDIPSWYRARKQPQLANSIGNNTYNENG
jgi:hypothetical protein